jgi:hypothetical protein
MNWTNRIEQLPVIYGGFPVAKANNFGGYKYKMYESARAFVVDACRIEDKADFALTGRFKKECYHLFSLEKSPARYIVDIDIKNTAEWKNRETILDTVCRAMLNIFNKMFGKQLTAENNIWVSESNADGIGSYHVVLSGCCFIGMDCQKYMFQALVDQCPQYISYLDNTQSKNHLMRAVNCAKPKTTRFNTLRTPSRGFPVNKNTFSRPLYATGGHCINTNDGTDYDKMVHQVVAELEATKYTGVMGRDMILKPNDMVSTKYGVKRKINSGAIDSPNVAKTVVSPVYSAAFESVKKTVPELNQYYLLSQKGNYVTLQRLPSLMGTEMECVQCKKTHSSDNAFFMLSQDQKSFVFNCFRACQARKSPLEFKI